MNYCGRESLVAASNPCFDSMSTLATTKSVAIMEHPRKALQGLNHPTTYFQTRPKKSVSKLTSTSVIRGEQVSSSSPSMMSAIKSTWSSKVSFSASNENAEPSFAEQSLDELFARFPAGNYTFKGRTVDGQTLNGKAPLKHSIPAGPEIVSPVEGAVLDPAQPVVIDWEPVANPFPGTPSAVSVVGYQVIVEQVKPQPLRVFSATLQSTVTQVTVSPEFIQSNAEYTIEVLAIEPSGNQTISEGGFKTQ
jgi:hypothetical protein